MNDRPKRNTPAGEAPQGAGLLDTLSRGHFGTTCPEAVGSVPTPEHAAGMGQEAFSGRTAKVEKRRDA